MPLHVSSTCAHHQEVKIALHSLWYRHIYRCDDTRGCVMLFWPADDEHMCSKHVEAWNKLIVKQKFCASCWLITEINRELYIVLNTVNLKKYRVHFIFYSTTCVTHRKKSFISWVNNVMVSLKMVQQTPKHVAGNRLIKYIHLTYYVR